MRVLVSGSTATMRRLCVDTPDSLGVFFNPNSVGNYARQPLYGVPWAADNAAFSGFDAAKFERMLDTLHLRAIPRCLFVTMPDVVADAGATLRLFWQWYPILRRYGWPLALVAQDGLTVRMVPWGVINALFIGGSTRWKLGAEAYTLCGYAKALGKHVHVGRVNSERRIALFSGVADSIDGTGTSRYGDVFIPKMTAAATRPAQQRALQRELL